MATYQFDFDLSKTFNDEYDDLVFLQYFNDDDPRSKICIIGSTDRVYGIMAYNATTDIIGFILKNTQASSNHATDAIRSFTTTWTSLKSTLQNVFTGILINDSYLPVGCWFDEENQKYVFTFIYILTGSVYNAYLDDQTYTFTDASIRGSLLYTNTITSPANIVRVDISTGDNSSLFIAQVYFQSAETYLRIAVYGTNGYSGVSQSVSDSFDADMINSGFLKNPLIMRSVLDNTSPSLHIYPILAYSDDSTSIVDVTNFSCFIYLTNMVVVLPNPRNSMSHIAYPLILNDISIKSGGSVSALISDRVFTIQTAVACLIEEDGMHLYLNDDSMSLFSGLNINNTDPGVYQDTYLISDLYYPDIMTSENDVSYPLDKSYSGDLLPICSLGNLYDDGTYEQSMIYYYPGNGGIYYIRPYGSRSSFPRVSVYEVIEEDYYLAVEDVNGDVGEIQISKDYRIQSITATQESDTSILLTIHCYRYDDEDDTQDYTLTLNYTAPEGYEASDFTDSEGNTLEIGSTFTYSSYPEPTDSYIIWTLNYTEETEEPEPEPEPEPTTGIQITLYQRSDDENVLASASDLTLTEIATMTGTFRESTSLTNPEITFQWSEYQDFNFVYIRNLQRYYFVRDIAFRSNNLITMKLEEDVLTSFHDDIMNLKEVYVERQEFDYNDLLIDNNVPSENEDEMEIICCDNDYIQLSNEISDYSLEGNIVFNIFVHD